MIIQKIQNGNWTATCRGKTIETYSMSLAIYWGLLEVYKSF